MSVTKSQGLAKRALRLFMWLCEKIATCETNKLTLKTLNTNFVF